MTASFEGAAELATDPDGAAGLVAELGEEAEAGLAPLAAPDFAPAPFDEIVGNPLAADVGALTMLRVVEVPAGCEIETVAPPLVVEDALVDEDPELPPPLAPGPAPFNKAGVALELLLLPPPPPDAPPPPPEELLADGLLADAPPLPPGEGVPARMIGMPGAFVPASALLTSVAALKNTWSTGDSGWILQAILCKLSTNAAHVLHSGAPEVRVTRTISLPTA
ncbi:MAG: hypothetical protein ABSE46_19680 [Terracidiphilus sp.]|jgi:hypothetical protein